MKEGMSTIIKYLEGSKNEGRNGHYNEIFRGKEE